MAWFTPEKHPDEQYFIFGDGGAARLAEELGIELLAQVPLVASVGQHNDDGTPVAALDTLASQSFHHLSHMVVDAVDRRNSDLPPTIRVDVSRKNK
jgi:ATP-binding protein involved in chromosome partitioning